MRTILSAAFVFTVVTTTCVSAHTMHRSDVRHAQQLLSDLGYPTGVADGRVGPQTRTAIRNFQRDRNLNATGELTEETMSALETASTDRPADTARHGEPPTASAIRRAQQQLDEQGYPVGRIDGEMGTETRTAIRNFQRDKNLNATGELDVETRSALDDAGRATSGSPREPR